MSPRIGSLFCGYGGLDLAVESVYGGEMAWYSEVDKGALKILAHRFPGVPNVGDVTAVDWSQVEPVDILTGGSPCQDLSHAGRRAGMTEGTRSNLWVAMREAIAQLRPPMVVWENVGGAFSAAADSEVEPCAGCVGDGPGVHLRALGRVLGDLSSLGYDAYWHAVRAADVGAPHGRLRVFVVATDATHDDRNRSADAGATSGRARIDDPWPCKWCADGLQIICGHGPAADPSRLRRRTGRTSGADEAPRGRPPADIAGRGLLPTPRATDGTKGGPGQRGSSGDLMLPSAVALLPTPKHRDFKNAGSADRAADRAAERAQDLPEVVVNQLLPTPRVKNNENRQSEGYGGEGGNFYGLLRDAARWGDYAAAIARWETILGRPAPAPTQTSKKGNPQLSPAFVEWMMGLARRLDHRRPRHHPQRGPQGTRQRRRTPAGRRGAPGHGFMGGGGVMPRSESIHSRIIADRSVPRSAATSASTCQRSSSMRTLRSVVPRGTSDRQCGVYERDGLGCACDLHVDLADGEAVSPRRRDVAPLAAEGAERGAPCFRVVVERAVLHVGVGVEQVRGECGVHGFLRALGCRYTLVGGVGTRKGREVKPRRAA